ncbi:hypothetical protein evm_011646 [Chilo suppressalis]|nr:hypothetical protein evm_011646 [Chilo suppressalis]
MCRFCLSRDDAITSIYDRAQKAKNTVTLPLKILSCLSIEAFPSDKMPTYICSRCSLFMDLFYEFKEICRSADQRILQYIQTGSTLETLNWPVSLTNVFRDLKRLSKNPHVVKAVMKDGATVKVTSQEVSNSEEDDEEDVYNVKIGDGSKDIEVVVSNKNNIETEEINTKPVSDNESKLTDIKDHVRNLEEGCWACDECNCTYPLQQLLELHKMQKHRTRNVQCSQCDAKFFTKYDLMTHTLRHTDEVPFQCVACDKRFKRLFLLKRHEKIIHANIPQLACPNCPATFLSIEELMAHQRRHVRHSERNHACGLCDKKFHEKSTLQRHIDLVHEKKPTFRCEYCPEQFTSVSKLTRHVRSHAGERPYPCKYCSKSFLKSHHYTRHLRVKHRETIRKPRGPFGQSDYRCEQCEEAFTTQDDLIYHSAIHATQNLICPLCQEKFENVDAVTAHIKSHVNGMEFMCDLCELVFTTKEKLENHLTSTHADELDQDDSSMELDGDDSEDDNDIHVKEEDGEMVVEIKKTDSFMLPDTQPDSEEKADITQSEGTESESEATYTELATVDTLAIVKNADDVKSETDEMEPATKEIVTPAVIRKLPAKTPMKTENQTASILRKAEEVKRRVKAEAVNETKEKIVTKAESTNSIGGASDKSLRLLEKELQELKRTNTRNESIKTPAKPMENLRNRRPQLYSSTPKTRATEEKKAVVSNKSPAIERKVIERRITKENKEPKEVKEVKEIKETKEVRENKEVKDTKEVRETKESKDLKEPKQTAAAKEDKETPKSLVKNGPGNKMSSEENVRRSTRPSKIKDYAKMIRDKSQDSSDEDSDMDEEYKEVEKIEMRGRPRRGSVKAVASKSPAAAALMTPPVRKRGRPRKEPLKELPAKIKRADEEEPEPMETESKNVKDDLDDTSNKSKHEGISDTLECNSIPQEAVNAGKTTNNVSKSPSAEQMISPGGVVMSPTGQTLKKVPIRALPPGVKPLPLPVGRPMGPGELCEMQIGKKVVKVQKIVMTKAEVEAMAKQGLVEMKDGTMVLKQGIKLPSSEALKSSLVGDKDASKESPSKVEKPAPTQSSAIENS